MNLARQCYARSVTPRPSDISPQALRGMPDDPSGEYSLSHIHFNLGIALYFERQFEESVVHLSEAARLAPNEAEPHYQLALVLASSGTKGRMSEAMEHYSKALSLQPDIDQSPTLHRISCGATRPSRPVPRSRFICRTSTTPRARARRKEPHRQPLQKSLNPTDKNRQPPRRSSR